MNPFIHILLLKKASVVMAALAEKFENPQTAAETFELAKAITLAIPYLKKEENNNDEIRQ